MTFEFVPTYRSNLLTQYYDHKQTLAEATYIGVGINVVKGTNADLLEAGTIRGVVTAQAGGARLPEVEVCAVSLSPPPLKSCDETDANGEYSVHSFPSGLYKVGFWGQGKSAEYEPTYYKEQSSLAQATPISVTAGQTTPGVDAALTKGGQISGQVLGAGDGMPLNDVAVCLFSGSEATPRGCTDTAETGAYAFQGLPTGSYQVGFSLEDFEIGGSGGTVGADHFGSQYYDRVAARGQAATISILAPATVAGIDARLSEFSVLPPSVTVPTVRLPSGSVAVVPEPEPKATRCKKPNIG